MAGGTVPELIECFFRRDTGGAVSFVDRHAAGLFVLPLRWGEVDEALAIAIPVCYRAHGGLLIGVNSLSFLYWINLLSLIIGYNSIRFLECIDLLGVLHWLNDVGVLRWIKILDWLLDLVRDLPEGRVMGVFLVISVRHYGDVWRELALYEYQIISCILDDESWMLAGIVRAAKLGIQPTDWSSSGGFL